MKILIGYDGSGGAEAALDDLAQAGLPNQVEALIFSVAEIGLTPPADGESAADHARKLATDPQYFKTRENGEKAALEIATLADHACRRTRQMFPSWNVLSEVVCGTSPAKEILRRAGAFAPDLIVVGSHGRTAVGRIFLGSISQKVITEAVCSVRVARGKIEVDPAAPRIIVGFDGSPGAQAAVEAVAQRNWPQNTEIRLVTATAPIAPAAIGRFIPPVANWIREEKETKRDWVKKLDERALYTLHDAGLTAHLRIHDGNPKQILVEEAARWSADCIFVGANTFGSRLERVLLGSVSAAVAARAVCSVEVVRNK